MKSNTDQTYLLETRKILGRQIKQIRKEKGMSQQELADRIGTSRTTITKIEAGSWALRFETITVIGLHLGFTLQITLNQEK